MRKIIAIIPARYQSSRFPGKPLVDICGKPMVQWVYERVDSLKEISEVYVATDDMRIFGTVKGFGGNAVMTGECSCGTDRVYQACKNMEADIVLNVQGDEPLIKPEMISDLIDAFEDENVQMATLKKKIDDTEDLHNPNVVKVVTDKFGDAMYFSRYAVPYDRDKKNVTAISQLFAEMLENSGLESGKKGNLLLIYYFLCTEHESFDTISCLLGKCFLFSL